MANERLSADDRDLLGQVPTMRGDLRGSVEDWIQTGTAPGALERDRAQAEKAAASTEGVSRSDVVAARNQWIRVVRAILAGLDLAEGVDEETRTLILQPLRNAVKKATDRSESKGDAQTAPTPAS